MITSLALLLAAPPLAQAPRAARPYPLVEVLSEARQSCEPKVLPAADDSTALNGWIPYQPETGSWLADYVKRNSEGGGAVQITPLTFTKTVAGVPLFAFVARMRFSFAPEAAVFSCEVFDPEAPPVTAKAVAAWAGRSPRRSSGRKANLVFLRWEPGLGRGIDETTITSMASAKSGSAASRSGLAYTAIRTKSVRDR